MRVSEWVAVGYFAYLVVVAWLKGLPAGARAGITAGGALASAVILGLSQAPASTLSPLLRDWLPALWVLVGYKLSGLLFVAPMPRVEARFLAIDRWLYDRLDLDRQVGRSPRLLLEYVELAYFLCFLLVPLGCMLLQVAGRGDLVDRYWTIVLGAEFGAFGVLAWVQTRPPRDLEPPTSIDGHTLIFRRLNLAIVEHGSIRVNTFPSGHTAGSFGIAIAVGAGLPVAGAVLMVIAATIGVACVIGRYHYAVDVASGVLVAAAVWGMVAWAG